MIRTKSVFKADNLFVMAQEVLASNTTADKLQAEDVTDMYNYEIEMRVKKGELINMNMNGRVRTGKSTAAMAECIRIKELIKQYHNIERPFSNKNVCRDQNEYSRTVKRRPNEFKYECDVIDEWSEMELAGYNATIEEKYLKQFSDVQAGRYYHRIACSPSNITDPNTDILMQVVPGGADKETGETLFLLSYRLFNGETAVPVLLGHVRINVKNALQHPAYKEYLKKKEEKWELMNKHNVMSPRQLEYAQIILATYKRIVEIAKMGLTNKKHFKVVLQEEADKRGVWFSILGDKDVLETIEGMAETTHLIEELGTKTQRIKTRVQQGKQKKEDYEIMKKHLKEIENTLNNMIARQKKLDDLWTQYQKIDS